MVEDALTDIKGKLTSEFKKVSFIKRKVSLTKRKVRDFWDYNNLPGPGMLIALPVLLPILGITLGIMKVATMLGMDMRDEWERRAESAQKKDPQKGKDAKNNAMSP